MSENTLPTREQIAEALRESDRNRKPFSGDPWLHNADAMLALIQSGEK